ncbi:MAG: hypothetical protein V4471_05355, partial [Pseudomonadota bacterium]
MCKMCNCKKNNLHDLLGKYFSCKCKNLDDPKEKVGDLKDLKKKINDLENVKGKIDELDDKLKQLD